MSYSLRNLEYSDREWVVYELGEYTIRNDMKREELYNPDQLLKIFDLCATNGKGFVVECDGKPVGVIGGLQHGHIFNPDVRCYSVVFWFVHEKYRKTRASWLLLKSLTTHCKEQGLELSLALQEYSLSNPKSLMRLGFVKGETTYRIRG